MAWKVYVRKEREGACDPGLWISDELGNSVVDTGAMDCWPLSDEHKKMIEAVPDLLAACKAFVDDFIGYINSDGYDLPDPTALQAAIAKAEAK